MSIIQAREYLKAGQLETALQVAETIVHTENKDLLLADIACEYAKVGECDRALQIVEKIHNDRKNDVLNLIVKNYVGSEKFDKLQQIRAMINIPDDEDDEDWEWKSDAASDIAYAYAKADLFDKAVEFAESLENEYHKEEALWAIAYRYAEIGQFELIIKMAPASISAGDDPLTVIAELMVAQELECDRIIEIAKFFEEESYQKAMLISVVYQYANYQNNSDKLIKFARTVTDESAKYEALKHLIKSFIQAKEYERVLQIPKTIGLEKVRITSWGFSKTLKEIAELMVEQELECDRMIEITKTLGNDHDQRAVLMSVVDRYANTENNSDKLINFARSTTDESIKYAALEHIAKSFIQTKEYDRVLEIAKSIGLEKVRVTSWGFIIHPDEPT